MAERGSGTDGPDFSKEALEHAWNWFSLHATQRMQAVNFFLITTAFLVAAYGTAVSAGHPAIAMAVAALGSWLSWWFDRLESRIRELVRAGEAAMMESQRRLAERAEIAELRILQHVETAEGRRTAYSRVFNTLHWTTSVAFVGGFIYAVYLLIRGLESRGEVIAASVAWWWIVAGLLTLGIGMVLLLAAGGVLGRVGGTVLIVGGTALLLQGASLVRVEIKPGPVTFEFHGTRASGSLSHFQLERLGSVGPFPTARHEPDETTAIEQLNKIISVLEGRSKAGYLGCVVLIGRADKRPLRPEIQAIYDSNTGLAQARARWVGSFIVERIPSAVDPKYVMVLASGPSNVGIRVPADQLATDRSVEIYACQAK